MQRIRVIVTGRVQGVGFRWSTRAIAEQHGLTGSAVNRADGSVAVEAQGAEDAVASLRDWLRHGPPGARVTGSDEESLPVVEGESGFMVG